MRKKILSTLLATTMVMTAMSVPIFASATTSAPNLTAYNTAYSNPVKAGDVNGVELMVTGADSNWLPTALTETEAEAIQWNLMGDSDTNVNVYPSYYESPSDGFIASAWVDVSEVIDSGLTVVEAKNTLTDAVVDFSIVINPENGGNASDVTGISCEIYNGATLLTSFSGMTVSANNFYEESKYPSAFDCVAGLMTQPQTTVTGYNISYGFLNSITVNGTAYSSEGGYWLYSVEDSTGAVRSNSALVGGGDFALNNGDTVVFTYYAY